MRVKLISKSGDVVTRGKLDSDKLEKVEVLVYLGRHYRYSGLEKGTGVFKEIKLWDVTFALR